MRSLFLGEGKYARRELGKCPVRVNMRSGEGKYAQCGGKRKAPRRALVFRILFNRVRGAVASAELMGQFL